MQGCSAEDWNLIKVHNHFLPDNIQNVKFSGSIKLNRFNKSVTLFGGITFKTGIYNAWLHNCIVEDNVLIHNVRGYIANYHIDKDTIIQNITTLAVDGETTFGNGTYVNTINEGGGRAIPIYDHLSAHVAYIITLYRHRHGVVNKLEEMITGYADSIKSRMGYIGRGSYIINCNTIRNVRTGPATRIDGAKKLENGSINSNVEAPVIIGEGVILEDFIISSGSKINDATLVAKCFIGQGCILDKHYSAVESLFFANCQGFHGEACSIFAGPYTVTHHKSTLLIAGMFSFLNAGSGSNQSNHLYKLGPIHQGIVERGAKTTSDSYILWPAKVGAFSLVMGRHYKHSDTTDFPFSYIIESNDETILVPAINLRSVGTIRDSKKWPKRDIRTDSNQLDKINFNLLSPYTVHRMMTGRDILLNILSVSGEVATEYSYKEMKIRKKALLRGIELYEMAIWKFLGNSLITRIKSAGGFDNISLFDALKKDSPLGSGKWLDMAGLLCPVNALEKLLSDIENGAISTMEEVKMVINSLHLSYYNYEWSWAYDALEHLYGKKIGDFTPDDVIAIVERWKKSVLAIDDMLYHDALKEYSDEIMTGFGIDGDDGNVRTEDFRAVIGDPEDNEMIKEILAHKEKKSRLGEEITGLMKSLAEKTN